MRSYQGRHSSSPPATVLQVSPPHQRSELRIRVNFGELSFPSYLEILLAGLSECLLLITGLAVVIAGARLGQCLDSIKLLSADNHHSAKTDTACQNLINFSCFPYLLLQSHFSNWNDQYLPYVTILFLCLFNRNTYRIFLSLLI